MSLPSRRIWPPTRRWRERWTGAVTVEGWVFDIGTGAVTVIDPAGGDRTIAA